MLIAAEALSRLLHPREVLEAEDYSTSSYSPSTPPQESNNRFVAGGNLLNGGESLVDLSNASWVEYTFLPPAVPFGPSPQNYRILLRIGCENPGGGSVQVDITQPGSNPYTDQIAVPEQARHDYVVLELPSTVSLLTGVTATLRLTFSADDFFVDDVVVKNRGV